MEMCFYCNAPISERNLQRDHFPIPASKGGKDTVRVCTTCHDCKDRFAIGQLPVELIAELMRDWNQMGRWTRLFLGRVTRLWQEQELPVARRKQS